MNRPRRRRVKTPREGKRFRGEVRDLSSQGHGVVAAPDGRVCFVPGVWLGESGEFEITQTRGSIAHARLVSLDLPAPERIQPPCPHHGVGTQQCGGCAWQFVSYAAQLAAKDQRIRQTLERLHNPLPLKSIWASEQTLGYRNRAQFKTDGQRLGYMAQGTREIVDVSDCPILNDSNRQQLAELRQSLPNEVWRPKKQREFLSLHTDDDTRAESITVNQRRPFRQGNSAQNARLRKWLGEQLAAIEPGPTVELYAGSGNLTDVLVDAGCTPITAIDSFEGAVEELAERKLPGVQAVCADLDKEDAQAALKTALASAELLVLDPPRAGAPQLASFLKTAKRLHEVIYISCDLATYSRDLKVLLEKGFRPELIQPIDMFPHTPHIELMTRLRR